MCGGAQLMEWRLTDEITPYVSTYDFHRDRPRAPHLEQPGHRARLDKASEFVRRAAQHDGIQTWSDLGCGDGGLLSLSQDAFAHAWGYDWQPSNAAGWAERDVSARALDVFGADWHRVQLGDVVSLTEVLEHLSEPHMTVVRIRNRGARYLVASSPVNETPANHDVCHAWAWDMDGYRTLLADAGWHIDRHEVVGGQFQVILGS
jgi:hypothetical protein